MKVKNEKGLTFSEKLSCYLTPFEVYLTTGRLFFHKKLNKKFDKEIKEYLNYGELKKADDLKIIQKNALKVFYIFGFLIVVIGLIIVLANTN